jgi:hypothetical protein
MLSGVAVAHFFVVVSAALFAVIVAGLCLAAIRKVLRKKGNGCLIGTAQT